jgi:SAM-dependent methyltransferase
MESTTFKLMYDLEEKHWWFKGRRSLVKKLIKNYINNATNLYILDAGCGTGLLDKELKKENQNYHVKGIDGSSDAVGFSLEHGNDAVLGSLDSCPFPDHFFDVILLLDVIEHVPDDKQVLAEMDRLLKPNGIIIIFVPAFKLWWSRQDVFLGHYRRYTVLSLKSLFPINHWSTLASGYFNFILALPTLFVRKLSDLLHLPLRDEISKASCFNFILEKIFSWEIGLLPGFRYPFGVSSFIVVRKK